MAAMSEAEVIVGATDRFDRCLKSCGSWTSFRPGGSINASSAV